MPGRNRDELLKAFRREGRRSYADAQELLKAWDFEGRRTAGGHALWAHPRGITLTLTVERELGACYRALVVKKVCQVQLHDE